MNVELEDLKEKRLQGHRIALPVQGIQCVHQGMAEAMKLPIDNPEDWNWISLVDPNDENRGYIFIFQHQSTWDYIESWRRSLIDYTKFEVEIEISFFQIETYSDQSGGTVLKYINVANVAKAIENKLACNVTVDDKNTAQILIKYSTKSSTTSEPEQLAEIDAFKFKIEEYLQAVSILTDLGYSYINENISKPETFWKSGRPFSNTQINVDELKALDSILCQGGDVRIYSQKLATLNSLASFNAQIVFGFECIKSLLLTRAKARQRSDLFNLKATQEKNLEDTIGKAIESWFIQNKIEKNQQQNSHIKNKINGLFKSTTPKIKERLLLELHDLDIDIIDGQFEELWKLRNDIGHSETNEYNQERYESGMKFIRDLFKKLIQKTKKGV
jgi:hypothetical protein